ncbi:hypothetical protein BEWA_006990 [Theileria equi strain WA]|uniref:Uncharacterized protein n=1 Tax=Theileria equi strain WA TaxID=1537102 RepID=L0B0E6_THEEQ|nr:hypothetical protein BEWA_006990 [Theileria equi strain WA]AFZ81290.1 hypothetical protein BEWA_006990 [Theileria equi strain WA]|eukprot:XP_004830956.1 hypothetical protein BEWA_006990 [Theileria equi strain WA]
MSNSQCLYRNLLCAFFNPKNVTDDLCLCFFRNTRLFSTHTKNSKDVEGKTAGGTLNVENECPINSGNNENKLVDGQKPTKVKENDSIKIGSKVDTDITEAANKSVVLRKPIPRNFIKETLLPHLEHNVAYNAGKFPPSVMLQIGIAYSKLPAFIRQRSIEDALVESFRYRMVDFGVSDCIQLLNTCLQLQGLRSVAVYDEIISRLETPHLYNSMTSLNRLGVCRALSRIIGTAQPINEKGESFKQLTCSWGINDYKTSILRPWSYIVRNIRDKRIGRLVDRLVTFGGERILPQLEEDLSKYGTSELTHLLSVLAQRTERDNTILDFPIVAILMHHIIRMYDKTPLLYSLSNLCSLCRLKIRHDKFIELVSNDLKDPLKTANIYHKHLSRTIWVLARFDLLDKLLDDLMPHVIRNIPIFDAAGFSRLAQTVKYYKDSDYPSIQSLKTSSIKISLCLLPKAKTLTTKDSIFFLTGALYLELLPLKSQCETFESSSIPVPNDSIQVTWESNEKWLPKANQSSTRSNFLKTILDTFERLDSDYDLVEIQRIIDTISSFENYKYILELLPESWKRIVEEYKNEDHQ